MQFDYINAPCFLMHAVNILGDDGDFGMESLKLTDNGMIPVRFAAKDLPAAEFVEFENLFRIFFKC